MKNAIVLSTLLILATGCATTNDSSTMSSSTSSKSAPTIADVAMSTGMHNTLVTALKAAGLADMLMQPGEYTIFAPTDAAFAKLPAGTVDMLLMPANREKLRSLLQYHVVSGRVTAKQVMAMPMAKTASGQNVKISRMGDQVMVGDAHVVKADVMASNGIVHVIDAVLMPSGM